MLISRAFLKASSTTVDAKLQGYSGFDSTLCYGDILLSYVWESSYPNRDVVSDAGRKETTETAKAQPALSEEIADKKTHDFIRTHFHRATHCDFCTKKVRAPTNRERSPVYIELGTKAFLS